MKATARTVGRITQATVQPSFQADSYLDGAKLSSQAYWDLSETSRELERHEAAGARGYFDGSERANREYVQELYALIGAGNVAEYLAFRKESLAAMRSARRRLLKATGGARKLARLRRSQADASLAFFRKLGVDLRDVRQLQKEFRRTKDTLFEATLGRDEILASRLRRRKNQNFAPPYDGSTKVKNVYMYRDDPSDFLYYNLGGPTPQADRITGKVGWATGIGVKDASNLDEYLITLRAGVWQVYQVPSPGGNVIVRILAKLVSVGHSGFVDPDFFGTSGAYVRQRMRIHARVWGPSHGWSPLVVFPVFDRLDEDSDDHSWSNTNFVGDLWTGRQLNFGPAIVPGTYSPGTTVVVEAGILHRNRFIADDCEIHSSVTTFAEIKEIGLSVTPFGDLP